MKFPAPIKTKYSTEWRNGENLNMTVIVSKHNLYETYSAGYMYGTHVEWLQAKFETLEAAHAASSSARAEYEAKQLESKAAHDRAFAATVGMMLTSTGDWVTADEWDDIEGAM